MFSAPQVIDGTFEAVVPFNRVLGTLGGQIFRHRF